MEPDKRPDLVRGALTLALAAGLTGCTTTRHAATPPSALSTAATITSAAATTSQAPTPSRSATLRELDLAPWSYSARYRLTSDGQPAVTVDVAATRTAYSLRLTGPGSTSVFVVNAKGSFSCELATHTRCFLVAKPGKPVPAALDPGLERVFRTSLHELATHPDGYEVSVVEGCFSVRPKGSVTPDTVNKGTYCWSSGGVLTKYVSASGSLTLVRSGKAPTLADIVTPPVS